MNKEILKEIEEYCELNELEYTTELDKLLKDGFVTLKYGATPMSHKDEKKVVEVEKIVEKVVEVEKIVKVSDDSRVNELLLKISDLEDKVKEYKGLFESAKSALRESKNNTKKDIYGE